MISPVNMVKFFTQCCPKCHPGASSTFPTCPSGCPTKCLVICKGEIVSTRTYAKKTTDKDDKAKHESSEKDAEDVTKTEKKKDAKAELKKGDDPKGSIED